MKTVIAGMLLLTAVGNCGTLDYMSFSTVLIREVKPVVELANGKNYEVWLKPEAEYVLIPKKMTVLGSGLIVIADGIPYLVTARHVATGMTENCEITFRGTNGVPETIGLRALTGQPQFTWIHSEAADISVHALPTITTNGSRLLEGRAVPLGWLESQTNLPSRDLTLTALGFPLGLGAAEVFEPISKESKRSSGFLKDANGTFFLLQDPSVGGFSGGPLFQSGDPRVVVAGESQIGVASGGAKIWGFVSATYSDETGGKMCRITPAAFAVDLIQKVQGSIRVTRPSVPAAN